MKKFQNKIVMITGASSGIGAALVREFAQQGAKVAMVARRAERLKTLADEMVKAGLQAFPFVGDVTKEASLRAAVADIHQALGNIDIVVANAGFGVVGPFTQLTVEDFQRQFDTNVNGVLRTIYATLEDLKHTQGQLVLMGSVASYVSAPGASPYSMSKFAVRALAEVLYAELAPLGIKVTLISPGFVKTEIRNVDNYGQYQTASVDPIPTWVRMSAPCAAKQIVKAIAKQKREKIITVHGKIAVMLSYLLPGLVHYVMRKRQQH